jgi:hypothetical protein
MSYDYSSESTKLDLVNPYIFQNRVLFACATVLLLMGAYAFIEARFALQTGVSGQFLLLCALGFGLSTVALGLFTQAMKRLKFYFGRGKPESLAPEIPLGVNGDSILARNLQTLLRQRALGYTEPEGALQSVLYHRFPQLMTAPFVVQGFAKQYFYNLCTVLATLLSFLAAWFFSKDDTTQAWVSLAYFLTSVFWLVKPYAMDENRPLRTTHLIGLVAAGILLPMLLGVLSMKLPPLLGLTFHVQTFVLLICALVSSGLLLSAALKQTTDAPVTEVSNELLRLSMQSPPATLFEELARKQQAQWTEKIPNRCYVRIEPVTPINAPGGSFTGDYLEETQPMPILGRNDSDNISVFANPSRKFLALSDLFAALLIAVSALFVVIFIATLSIDQVHTPNIDLKNAAKNAASNNSSANATQPAIETLASPLIGVKDKPVSLENLKPSLRTNTTLSMNWAVLSGALMMISVALFCFKNSARLWGRFDFESIVVWVTAQGSYQTAKLGTGNGFNSQLQTENKIVRVEDMTVNLWRTRIETVCFGDKGGRQITSMYATHQEAQELAADLQAYVDGQSVLTAPQSARDSQKIAGLFQAGNALKVGEALLKDPLKATEGVHPNVDSLLRVDRADAVPLDAKVKFCSECGSKQAFSVKFCSDCGHAFSSQNLES